MNKLRPVSETGQKIIKCFNASLEQRNLTLRTIKEYTADIQHFIGWHEYQGLDNCQNVLTFSFDQISLGELKQYSQIMLEVKLKPSTIKRRLSSLKFFFNWAHQCDFINNNPAKNLDFVPLEKNPPRIINKEEEKRLLHAVKQNGNLRDQAILTVILYTGLRVGEICDIMVSDVTIHPTKRTIKVGTEKTRRIVPLNVECKSILEKHLKFLTPGSIYLFPSEKTGDRLTERALRHIIKKYMDIACLQGLSAYSLRHNFGYKKAQQTPLHELAHMMGHTSITTTKAYVKNIATIDSLENN